MSAMAQLYILTLLGVLLGLVHANGMYTKNSPVLQVTAKNYHSLIAMSNHTSILEFYAPWCGHCQSLKPAYEKAATNLAGLAKVAAINCDEESNKQFCSQMEVQGFPTLKIIKPGPKVGRPVVEDYRGARTAKGIVDAVVERIPNHVTKLQDAGLDDWLSTNGDTPKAILFTEKGTVSAMLRSVAVDFLGGISFAQVRSREDGAVQKFGITKFPSVILLPAGSKEPIIYSGEMKREGITKFLGQIAIANPDPAPDKLKTGKSSQAKVGKSKAKTSSTETTRSAKTPPAGFDGFQEIVLDDETPLESPIPIVESTETPVPVPDVVPAIPMLATPNEVESACLNPKAGNCLLVLLPKGSVSDSILPENAAIALTGLAEVANRYVKRHANIFPFYGVPAENSASTVVRNGLNLDQDTVLEILVINMKRGWWRPYMNDNVDVKSLEAFVDMIKLGEGTKSVLPEGFFSRENVSEAVEPSPEPEATPSTEPMTQIPEAGDPGRDTEPGVFKVHDEL